MPDSDAPAASSTARRNPVGVPANAPTAASAGTPGGPAAAAGSAGGGGGLPPVGPATAGAGGSDGGHIVDLQLERELQDSYLTYAMSTIMDRALPDVRDGLKPSQRRILVAMNDLRLFPGKKHLKCAKICGDTSGNYHPHGESVIYPTLANMAQKWRMRVPLIDPQGNFGSINPDPPAAMRYTEARLTHAAVEMLADLDLHTVEMQPNYDDRLQEPTVLPGKFPNLLVNGGVGIAVGMATSLAPHNPIEVLDSIVRVLEKPGITLGELMEDVVEPAPKDGGEPRILRRGIKGPDFPTGGVILGKGGIVEAYATGRGRIALRGEVRVEEVKGGGGRQQIIIDSIPYNLGLDTLMERIVEGVKEGKITDVSDVRDESGREAMVRVVVELKKGADPGVVEKQLLEFTPLQQTFSVNSIALVNRQPRTLSLKELIRYYIEHRRDVIRRRTAHLLAEARKRAHVLEGLILAVCDIDEVIRLIRASHTRQEAIDRLMARGFRIAPSHRHASMIPARLMEQARRMDDRGGVRLTRVQAEQIGAMRLIQLVGLEIEKLVADYRQVVEQIDDFEDILANDGRVAAIIRADCDEMKARIGPRAGQRLTRIEEGGDLAGYDLGALIAVEDMAVTISRQGYAKRVPLATYRQQGRGGKGIIGATAKDDDVIEHMFVASTHDDLLCFTNTGRVFKIKVYELPELSRQSKGRPLVNLLELKPGERTCAYLPVRNFEEGSQFLTFVSAGGIVKRTPLKDYRNVHKGGLIAVGLKERDTVLDVILTSGTDDILLATAQGMAIRFNEDDVRAMGRSAAGVKGIELASPADAAGTNGPDAHGRDGGDEVVGAIAIPMSPQPGVDPRLWPTADPALFLLTISENGFGKRTPVDEYRVQPESGPLRSQSRGGKGRVDIDASERNGRSVAALGVHASDDLVVTTRNGMTIRMPVAEIRQTGRGAQGVRIASLDEGDQVVAAARVVGEESE